MQEIHHSTSRSTNFMIFHWSKIALKLYIFSKYLTSKFSCKCQNISILLKTFRQHACCFCWPFVDECALLSCSADIKLWYEPAHQKILRHQQKHKSRHSGESTCTSSAVQKNSSAVGLCKAKKTNLHDFFLGFSSKNLSYQSIILVLFWLQTHTLKYACLW